MRRGRPLGLTIALAACTVLYGLYPLGQAAFFLLLQGRRASIELPARVVLQSVLAVAFLIVLVPAWLGRPPRIRLVLVIAVLLLLVVNVGLAVADLLSAPGVDQLDAAADLARTQVICDFALNILVGLYIIWYLSRYPSRAYYQGESGPPPDDTTA